MIRPKTFREQHREEQIRFYGIVAEILESGYVLRSSDLRDALRELGLPDLLAERAVTGFRDGSFTEITSVPVTREKYKGKGIWWDKRLDPENDTDISNARSEVDAECKETGNYTASYKRHLRERRGAERD